MKAMMKATKKGVLKRIKAQKSLGKTIKVGGKGPFDKEMILAARRATRGAKNVLVSQDDAKQIFEAARPTGGGQSTYDKVEKTPWLTSARPTNSRQQQMHSCANWWPRRLAGRRNE